MRTLGPSVQASGQPVQFICVLLMLQGCWWLEEVVSSCSMSSRWQVGH